MTDDLRILTVPRRNPIDAFRDGARRPTRIRPGGVIKGQPAPV